MTKKLKTIIITVSILFTVLLLVTALMLQIVAKNDYQEILYDSIESQLLSVATAARGMVDGDRITKYYSDEDIDEYYEATLASLRVLARETSAEYIYILRYINNEWICVFDTDTEETDEIIYNYEEFTDDADQYSGDDSASNVRDFFYTAWAGQPQSGVMNNWDIFGFFNTGAVPLFNSTGEVVAIVCVDTATTYVARSDEAFARNLVILGVVMGLMLVAGVILIIVLIRRLERAQTALEKMAHYDTVTGLPNRQYLIDHLSYVTSKKPEVPFALLFIDLDNFKQVNDNSGHDAGDELLRHIASYLKDSSEEIMTFRPSAGTLNITARIGGDEFIVVVPHIKTEEEAKAFAEKLINGMRTENIDKYIDKYKVGLSIGVALYPLHSENFHVLIKYADIAMYNAKKASKNCSAVFTDGMKKLED